MLKENKATLTGPEKSPEKVFQCDNMGISLTLTMGNALSLFPWSGPEAIQFKNSGIFGGISSGPVLGYVLQIILRLFFTCLI